MLVSKIGICKSHPSFNNETSQKREGFLEKFHTCTKNSADMNDTVVVPRTIFKGYLGFMAGTALTSLSGIFTKHPKTKNTLLAAGILTALYGTFAFVRPFVIKDAPGVDKTK
ncbi:TPA: hypothetical protein CPT81_08395 [Candidatus Gastranaerophilales bacterium HUM_20]|jgi:hypothetical protein|nr:unknown [Clostridium sp. CAG:729]DAB19396.1 MAG TPA: hypothetical protein CPT81_08395 [Candidatus Gastranaerophilales bacterium HUM_20]